MPASRRFPWLLLGAFTALYLVWGSTYLAIRIGVESWPPMLMAGVRFVIAGSLLYGFLRWRGVPAPTWPQWRSAGAIGFLLLSCGNGGVTLAEHAGVASGVAALAVATVPLFTLLFGLWFGHRNSRLEWAGILLGLGGIALLNLGSNLQASPMGAALLIFAAAAWAFGSVWSKTLPLPQGAMASAAEMLVGGGALLLGSVLSGERLTQMPSAAGWGALAYLVVFGSIVAFSSYMYLLKHVRPAAATSYAYVNPVVAVLLGIAFAGERIGAEEALAMGVIVGAVVLIGLPQWRRAPRQVA
ncbi:drug/metabolite exporter YedA [Pseudomonas parafulva]|uniref:Drug/metabolite exporter YedA n=1 Tax=Pseudomonas parafulva TaxID=157782 RepID=A0AAI8KF07_9PSED|nr:drug/metabolite exporter YedA [Pseudomonas parafulva]AXO89973.1 drug/metabolite exporter YedA [Pseudomonas parafulva]